MHKLPMIAGLSAINVSLKMVVYVVNAHVI